MKRGISSKELKDTLDKLKFNMSDKVFNRVFVDRRKSFETLKMLHNTLDSKYFKLIWRYLYNEWKSQYFNPE
jgi:hypothetical protein